MRWGVFAIALVVALVLDTSFMPVFSIGAVRPTVTPCLVVFVLLHAQRHLGLWAAFAAGLAVDIASPALFDGTVPYHVIGPTALGFVFGAQLAHPLRSMVVRRNPLAVGVLVALFSIAATLVTTAIFSARGWYAGSAPPWMPERSALAFLGIESLRALASGAVAIVAVLPLNGAVGLFGFTAAAPWAPRRG